MVVSEEAVPVHTVAMKLLDVRLKPASAITRSVMGEFTETGRQEIVCLKAGGCIELYRIESTVDEETVLKIVMRVETKSILRSLALVRFPGEKRDVIAVGSDSGAISVLDLENAVCKIVHCETFGKSGVNRATPGQYLASDPKGRAVMIAAVEKRKLVYVLNRDAQGTPTIASPLEAHRDRTLTFDTVGLDNGFDNPIFAAIELQYPETEDLAPGQTVHPDKQIAYYELDLGLNTVSRRWAATVPETACCIAAIPGGADGPGGVLMGCEDWVFYMHESLKEPIVCSVPRREHQPAGKGILVQSIVVHRQKKNKFFALAQSEVGDVYKLTLQVKANKVVGMEAALLDTLPTANSLNVSKLGMLFCASEFGDHHLYQFERIDLPDAPTSKSLDVDGAPTRESAEKSAPRFQPGVLRNLRTIFSLENPSPTTGIVVGELAGSEVSPQIYQLTGRGPTSALRTLRHGASVTELAVSDLPGVPGGIFTVSDNSGDTASKNDRFIVVSFADATLVLSIGETVEEVGKDSGFLTNCPTLACSALGHDGALCQVHPTGVRHIQKGQVKQWHCPGLKKIECASANEAQVLTALAGGEIIYFEIDPMSGNLTESKTKAMGVDVSCLNVGSIQQGRSRSMFAAVGCRDQTVRILSLEPSSLLIQKSSTALKSRPHSVALQNMGDDGALFLIIGLDDGSCLRVEVDPVTGSIGSAPTRRFLGGRPVALSRVSFDGAPSTLLLSSRPWICRRDPGTGKHVMAPLSYSPLDHGCSFTSEAVREGIVTTAGKTLRILAVDTSGMEGGDEEAFNSNRVSLRYTPRQMSLISVPVGADSQRKVLLTVVESDYNDFNLEDKKKLGFDPDVVGKSAKRGGEKGDDDAMDVDSDDEDNAAKGGAEDVEDAEERLARQTPVRGPIPSSSGSWASCLRLVDPSNSCKTLECLEMNRNEAALCSASVRFHSKGGEALLVVGTVSGMTLSPMKAPASHIVLYRIVGGDRLQLLHRTHIDDGPVLALAHFQGRLLAGVGRSLRLYEMGKKQLLRKCELRGLPTCAKTLQTVADRVFVGDMMRSIHIVRYDATVNRLVPLASDASPRPIVCQELLDFNTVAVGDKFGNISILRIPRGTEAGVVDLTEQRALWDSSREEIPKLELLSQYYVGEVVTSMTRSSLVAGGAESLIYATVTGRVGALVPFTSRDDVDFYTELEAALRNDIMRPTGRDPQSFRSYYAPVLHTIDGDLCDQLTHLKPEEQARVAEKLDRTVPECLKKLEDTHNSLL